MAGGLLWCTHWFHRALSGRGAHPVPCEMHSFAEYGITLAWIHPCRGSSDGKIFSCLPRGIVAWEGWEASFEKVLQKVHVLIYQIIQSQILASTKFKAKPKGTNRAFLSPDLQLSHAFANCQVNYLQRLSFKKNTEKIQTWVNNRAWALHTAILLQGMNWPPAKCIMQIYLHTADVTTIYRLTWDLSRTRGVIWFLSAVAMQILRVTLMKNNNSKYSDWWSSWINYLLNILWSKYFDQNSMCGLILACWYDLVQRHVLWVLATSWAFTDEFSWSHSSWAKTSPKNQSHNNWQQTRPKDFGYYIY